MFLPDITLHEPQTLDDASRMLRQFGNSARVMAGGTDLVVDLKTGRLAADHLVSLGRVPGLRGIRRDPAATSLRIGALTTIGELTASADLAAPFEALRDAAREMAATQVRNAATVGGNIAGAVPCADLPPVLLVLNASVILASSSGERAVRLAEFFLGPRQSAIKPGEVLTAITVPHPAPRTGAAYARFALREGNAIAVASAAASLTLSPTGTIDDASIALGAVAPVPMLADAAAKAVVGSRGKDAFDRAARLAMSAAKPITDVRGSADYRRELTRVLTQRALRAALERAKEATR